MLHLLSSFIDTGTTFTCVDPDPQLWFKIKSLRYEFQVSFLARHLEQDTTENEKFDSGL